MTVTTDTRSYTLENLVEIQSELNTKTPAGLDWKQAYSDEHFITAVYAEIGEILNQDSSPNYKWWKNKNPELVNPMMVKLEVVDMIHFILSLYAKEGKTEDFFLDNPSMFSRVDNICNEDGSLNHKEFTKFLYATHAILFNDEVCFDILLPFVGMDWEEMCALYHCKVFLNRSRWQMGDGWVKVDKDGMEDNERLFPIVEQFKANDQMNLADLDSLLIEEFFKKAA